MRKVGHRDEYAFSMTDYSILYPLTRASTECLTEPVTLNVKLSSKTEDSMTKATKNSERENRIAEEIIVDAYGPEEQAMGWYYYLEREAIED